MNQPTGTNPMNAADLYHRAFDLLPEKDSKVLSALREDQIRTDNSALLSIMDRAAPALEHMHSATKLADCDWNVSFSETGFMEAMKVHSKARLLAVLANTRARLALLQGRLGDALDDQVAMLALARHVGQGRLYISLLVQFPIEGMAIASAAPTLPRQDRTALEKAITRIDSMPESVTMSDVTRAEKVYFLDANRAGAMQVSPADLPQYIRTTYEGELGEAILARTEGDPALLVALIDQSGPAFDEMAAIWALPPARIDPAVAEFRARYAETNPMALSILEQSARIRPAWQRSVAQRALFRAALAIAAGGAQQLASVPDPFGDGPFQYRSFAGGFELTSVYEAMTFDGAAFSRRPVRLVVGAIEQDATT